MGCSRKIDRGCQASVCVIKAPSVVFSCFNQQNILLQEKVKSMLILECSDSPARIGRGSFPFQESQLDIGGVRGGEPSIRSAKYFKGIILRIRLDLEFPFPLSVYFYLVMHVEKLYLS